MSQGGRACRWQRPQATGACGRGIALTGAASPGCFLPSAAVPMANMHRSFDPIGALKRARAAPPAPTALRACTGG
eukprot:NODE_13197_length_1179_cov_7.356464.p7 GENE.NODE_13197_length_1179_cov_7.356464~~NODE_13197_length_1179_cov_7.356464.p7  ORF type:complete len:75 (-),score=7.43 NODE_13197_length_1179_cov_7.356464:319-543(-)